jgi:hypothetical protein
MKVLELVAYDCILGYDRLKKSSPITHDWEARTMEFMHGDTKVKLQGIAPAPMSLREIQADTLVKWEIGNDIWAWATVDMTPPKTEEVIPPAVQKIIQAHEDIFEEPTELPPSRL